MKAFVKRAGRFLSLFCLVSLISIGGMWLDPSGISAEEKSRTRTKATFLYYLSKFVVWPEGRFIDGESPVILCILGEDPFGKDLDLIVQTRNRREHFSDKNLRLNQDLIIRRLAKPEPSNDCHILFISASERNRFGAIMAGLKGASVLTVGDQEAFIRAGGMVNFALHDQKVHLEINLKAAKAAWLKISSKLLRLADLGPFEPSRREENH